MKSFEQVALMAAMLAAGERQAEIHNVGPEYYVQFAQELYDHAFDVAWRRDQELCDEQVRQHRAEQN
ncbi:MAG: hypothetical protein OXQ29_18000 [Rhodospirillaceae bacterium]|nr:hypothetical protein [Rhodospirillaceae bacterium]